MTRLKRGGNDLLRLVLQHARAYADNSDPAKQKRPTSRSATTSAQRQKATGWFGKTLQRR